MIKDKSILAVIPARGGSKGLPGKNILSFAGQPLISWTIQAAQKSKYIDKCIVSTDNSTISDVAKKYNGDVPFIEFKSKERKIIKKYLPNFDNKFILKDTNLKLKNSSSVRVLELKGLVKMNDYFDNFQVKETYNYNKKNFNIDGIIDLTNSKVNVTRLNYNKKKGVKSELKFNINFIPSKYYNVKNLNF